MKLLLSALTLVALLSLPQSARAFSVDQNTNVNTDGSTKFSDPDEKMPGFMLGIQGSNANTPSTVTSPQVTLPSMQDNDTGAAAFDRAYSHQEDK